MTPLLDAATPLQTASRKHSSKHSRGWGVGGTLSLGFCGGEAMFLINKLHKLFRKSRTIESMKESDV